MNQVTSLVIALAIAILVSSCAVDPPTTEIKAAEVAVESARKAGAFQYAAPESEVLIRSLRAIYAEQEIQEKSFVLFRNYNRVKEMALDLAADAKRIERLARERKLGKHNPPDDRLRERLARVIKSLFNDFEDYQNELAILLIGIASGGIIVGLVRKGGRKMTTKSNSLPTVRQTQEKKGAVAVDLKYDRASEAAQSWSTSRQDKKEQKRLGKAVEKRIQTGLIINQAIEQEVKIESGKNKVYEARGDYHLLPKKEQARIDRETAEEGAKFWKAQAEIAEAQKRIRDSGGQVLKEMGDQTKETGEAFQRAVWWQEQVRGECNFLDPDYREKFAKVHRDCILKELKGQWLSEYNNVVRDTVLISVLQRAFPEVLDWLEARLEVVRLAARFAVNPSAS